MGNNQLERRVLVDLHIHTAYEDPFFSGRKPEKIIQKALQSELSVIAITNHDKLFTNCKVIEKAQALGLLIIGGIEITSCANLDKEKNHPHILGIGLSDVKDPVPTDKTPFYVAKWIRDNNGLVIAPHPTRKGNKHSLSYGQLAHLYEHGFIDAVEVTMLLDTDEKLMDYIQTWSVAMLGASDAHWLDQIGCVATEIQIQTESVPSQQDVINAIQDKENKPIPIRIKEYPGWKKKAAKIMEPILYHW